MLVALDRLNLLSILRGLCGVLLVSKLGFQQMRYSGNPSIGVEHHKCAQ